MATGAQIGSAPDAVSLGDMRVFPGRPLPELRTGANLAFAAEARDQSSGESFALVCDPAALPRLDILPTLRKIEGGGGVVLPQAWRIVDWPATQRRHVVIGFDKPAGGRLVRSLEETVPPLGEEDAIRHFLTPVVAGLRSLHSAGLVHGSINPTNLFFQDATKRQLILGECCSTATVVLQPSLFIPIELAMATPAGRGEGQASDDIFGLGMTLAFLLLGRDPSFGVDDDMLIWARVDFGSYAATIGNRRMPLGLIELLRGMLADDPKVRWTIAEIEQWLTSRHVVSRQGTTPKRASRPFEFGGRPFFTARALGQAFTGDFAGAAAAIRTMEFDSWMQRALGDEASVALLKVARTEGSGVAKSEARDASLVARVGIALDFSAPIRYREFAVMIDGFGGAIGAAFLTKKPVQGLAEAIAQGVPQFMLTARVPPPAEFAALFKIFEQLRYQLEDRRLGFGAERLLYELCRSVHCLSPLIEADCVVTINALLPTLERRAGNDFGGSFPIDRHLAAFVAARFKSATNEWIDDVQSTEPAQRLLGVLRLFARLQTLSGSGGVPALARWVARQASPLIESYHHRPTRKYLAEQMERATASGRLVDMLALIDSPERAKRDEDGFAEAVRAHAFVANELQRATEAAAYQPQQVAELAGQLAAGLTSIAACAALVAAVVMLI